MDVLNAILLLMGGCLAGFLAGCFSVGGGVVLVPILLVFYQATGVTALVAIHLSIATSLFVAIFTTLWSAYQYQSNGHVIWRAVAVIGIAAVAAALLCSIIGGGLPSDVLRRIFGGAALITAIQLFGDSRRSKADQKPSLAAPGLAGGGLAIGTMTALTGVEGGLFSIPIMYSLHRFPLMKALGTSSAVMVITAVAAVIGYAVSGRGNIFVPPGNLGYVDPMHAIPLILGAIPGGILGAKLTQKVRTGAPRKIFAVLLLVVATRMLLL